MRSTSAPFAGTMISRRSISVSLPPSAAWPRAAASRDTSAMATAGVVNLRPAQASRAAASRLVPFARLAAAMNGGGQERDLLLIRREQLLVARAVARACGARARASGRSPRRAGRGAPPCACAPAGSSAPPRARAARAASRSNVRRRRPPARTRPPPRGAADRRQASRPRLHRGERPAPGSSARARRGARPSRSTTATAPASAPIPNGRQSEIFSHANRSRRSSAALDRRPQRGRRLGHVEAAHVRDQRAQLGERRGARGAAGRVRPHRRRLRGGQLAVDERRQPLGRVRLARGAVMQSLIRSPAPPR